MPSGASRARAPPGVRGSRPPKPGTASCRRTPQRRRPGCGPADGCARASACSRRAPVTDARVDSCASAISPDSHAGSRVVRRWPDVRDRAFRRAGPGASAQVHHETGLSGDGRARGRGRDCALESLGLSEGRACARGGRTRRPFRSRRCRGIRGEAVDLRAGKEERRARHGLDDCGGSVRGGSALAGSGSGGQRRPTRRLDFEQHRLPGREVDRHDELRALPRRLHSACVHALLDENGP